MVVTLMWMNSWAVVTISLSVLLVVTILLVCCVCWERKDNTLTQLYVLDEDGFKKKKKLNFDKNIKNDQGLFRRFSTVGSFSHLGILKSCKLGPTYLSTEHRYNSENDLLDSMDSSNDFDDTILHIENSDKTKIEDPSKKEEDTISCMSNDSKYTFYSIYPLTRASSIAETMRSALSHTDINV